MDWLSRMNKALQYIEDHLDGEIDYEELGRIVYCPAYYFQKMFSLMTEISLSEYIRSRRLAQAAYDLKNSSEKIIDIGLKYGYESSTAFTRAFKAMHGVSPSGARAGEALVKAYPPISFQITIKGAISMEYKIIEMEGFRAVGLKLATTTKNEANRRDIPKFWVDSTRNENYGKLMRLCRRHDGAITAPGGLMGICAMTGTEDLNYYIAAASDEEPWEGVEAFTVPGTTYAVFESKGPLPDSIQTLTKRIYTEWLPASGYGLGNGYDIEVYDEGDTRAEDYTCQVWVPIKKI